MGWGLAALVWGYALLLFVMTDFAKVRLYKLLAREGKEVERGEAANILRTVTPDKVFTFYRDYGQPLGVTSKSLDELAASVKSIEPSSVKFHVEEGDFENWFTMLGDKMLASQVAALRDKKISPDKLRNKVSSMVSKRVEQLHKIASSKEKEAQAPPASPAKTKDVANKDTGRLHTLKSAITSRLHVAGKKVGKDEATNVLRTVTSDKAFTFYSEARKPLGVTSKSLAELAASVKTIEPSSVKFHVEEGDFENWFTMLGDKMLASQVAALREKKISPDKLRKKVSSMVSKRVEQLHKIASSKEKEAQVPPARQVKS
jgi:chorismate mutase